MDIHIAFPIGAMVRVAENRGHFSWEASNRVCRVQSINVHIDGLTEGDGLSIQYYVSCPQEGRKPWWTGHVGANLVSAPELV